MSDKALGWQITVERPDGGAPEIFHVAISDERKAVEAVEQTLGERKGAIIKVKSQIWAKVYEGLGLKPGDVKAGARIRKKVDRT